MRVLFYTALSMAALLAGDTKGVELQAANQADSEMATTYDFFDVEDAEETLAQVAAEVEADKKDSKKKDAKKKDGKKKDEKKGKKKESKKDDKKASKK